MKQLIINSISGYLQKDFYGKPAGLWSVLAILLIWTLLKLTDIYYITRGAAGAYIIISCLVIVPANIVCLAGLWKRSKKILEFTKYWFWIVYMVSVFILPQYIYNSYDKWITFLLMAVIMMPVLLGWLILRSVFIRDYFSSVSKSE